MFSLARLLQSNCICKGWVLLNSLRLSLLPNSVWHKSWELHYLPLFQMWLQSITKFKWLSWADRLTDNLYNFCVSPIPLQNQAKESNFVSFWALKKKAKLSSRCVQLKRWLGISVHIKSGLTDSGLRSYHADHIKVLLQSWLSFHFRFSCLQNQSNIERVAAQDCHSQEVKTLWVFLLKWWSLYEWNSS